jgi:hypothetical protein
LYQASESNFTIDHNHKNERKLVSTGIPRFMLLIGGQIKKHGKRKPRKSRLLSNIKGEENRIEF